jgi:hypothetical protein
MYRTDISTLYSDNIFEMSGGKSENSTINSYTPSDKSLSEKSPFEKLIKANRELKRDLDMTTDELKKVKMELEKAKNMLKTYSK